MQPDMQTLLAGARSFVKKAAQTAVKTAADNGMLQQLLDGGRSLVSKVDLKNPMHTGAIGAGVGALGGLASGAMSDEEEPGYMQRALMGGLAGGGLGAGAGALNAKYNPAAQPSPPKTPKLVPPAIGSPEQLANRKKLDDLTGALRPKSPAATPVQPAATAATTPTATPAATPQPNPFVRPPEQDVAEFISKLNTPPDEYVDMARGGDKRRYPPAFAHKRLLELSPDDSKLKHIIHSARRLAAARASQPHPGEIPQELWESIYGKYPYPEKPRGPGWQATEAFPTF